MSCSTSRIRPIHQTATSVNDGTERYNTMTIWTCNAGSFSGFEKDGCAHVAGIRYATSKRWEPPIPYVYDTGVHACTSPAPFAVQLPSKIEFALAGTAYETFPQEESCQYLSITMPAETTPESNLPVMVWIHGGAYRNGGCDGPSYDRSPLARENDVIVVGVNYRLGVLGFVRDQDGKPSNNGLLDILEALLWINRNISAFGGDPGNVTLFGQSAGADAIMRIMAIDGAELLYRRAIMQSAPLGTLEGRTAMEAKMLEELNAVPDDIPTHQLLDAQASIVAHVNEKGPAKRMVFAPHFGVFPLPSEEEAKAQMRRAAQGHELLIGAMTREVAAYVGTNGKFAALDRFPITRPVVERVIERIGSEIFNVPVEEFARSYAEAGGTAFLYSFSWMQGQSVLGASHCSDCLLLFGAGEAEGKPGCMGLSAREVLEAGAPFRKIWADFAKTGKIERASLDGIIDIQRLDNAPARR